MCLPLAGQQDDAQRKQAGQGAGHFHTKGVGEEWIGNALDGACQKGKRPVAQKGVPSVGWIGCSCWHRGGREW